MAVDITDMVDALIAEVNIPGGNAFPDAVTGDWEQRLFNAFWETVLDGVVSNYTMDDNGSVTPTSGTTEFAREFQQLVVFYAGISIVRNSLRTLNAVFRAKAGPVEFETQNAATVMKSILDELVRRRNIILTRLSDLGMSQTVYVDSVIARSDALTFGETYWVGHSYDYPYGGTSYPGSSW